MATQDDLDRSAWQELIAFLDARQQAAEGGEPYHWPVRKSTQSVKIAG